MSWHDEPYGGLQTRWQIEEADAIACRLREMFLGVPIEGVHVLRALRAEQLMTETGPMAGRALEALEELKGRNR
jgi:hypothetical protein